MESLRRTATREPRVPGGADAVPAEAFEGAAPGVVAMLENVSEDRTHSVLDLGAAAATSLRLYTRFARHVRFVDLFGGGWSDVSGPGSTLLHAVPAQPAHPYDLIFAWDVLDRLSTEERTLLVQRLTELTAPRARLHLVVRAADHAPARPLRFMLADVDRMRFEPTGTTPLPRTGLLPAQVAALLGPFHVLRAFTLKNGLREYVAVRDR